MILQWKREDKLTNVGEPEEQITLSADVVGYDEGDNISFKVYDEDTGECVDELESTVKDGRILIEWQPDKKEENIPMARARL